MPGGHRTLKPISDYSGIVYTAMVQSRDRIAATVLVTVKILAGVFLYLCM